MGRSNSFHKLNSQKKNIPYKKKYVNPYELWKRRKPSYKYLKVWRCLAKVVVPNPKMVKIGPKIVYCVFISYTNNSSVYKFLVYK